MQGKHMLSRTLDSLRKALPIHALSNPLFTKLPLSSSYMYSTLSSMQLSADDKAFGVRVIWYVCLLWVIWDVLWPNKRRGRMHTEEGKRSAYDCFQDPLHSQNLFSIGGQQTRVYTKTPCVKEGYCCLLPAGSLGWFICILHAHSINIRRWSAL